jgi:hypothetical protein
MHSEVSLSHARPHTRSTREVHTGSLSTLFGTHHMQRRELVDDDDEGQTASLH